MKNSGVFFEAIRNGALETVNGILVDEPDIVHKKDQRGSSALILASYYNHNDIVELLLQAGAKIDEKDGSGNTALMGVCFKGFYEVAKALIEKGAEVNEQNNTGETALLFAVTFNHLEIAKMLLDNRADTSLRNSKGNTAMDQAMIQGAPVLIDLLNTRGVH